MADTKRIVFYSWQSDLSNKTNWGFIQDALERAIKAIHKDDTIEIKPVIDRDTQGVAGSPDISKTIFGKIRQSDIFVCDVSIVGSVPIGNNAFRAMPNPNVLVELGFALGILDDSRIIMVANEAFGKVESLPFDLRPRRVVSYYMPVEDEPASARKVLQDKLTLALTTILKELDALSQEEPNKSLAEQAKIAIGTAGTNQGSLIKQYMRELANKIAELNPKYDYENTPHCEEQLLEAINSSTGLVLEFAQVAEAIALADTVAPSQNFYKGFEHILDLYTFPKEHIPSVIYPFEHDLAKFR